MKKNRWQPYVGFIILSEAVGLLAGVLTRNAMPAYDALLNPSLTPPDLAFPIAWGVLYLLMGIGAARIYQTDAPGRKKAIAVFGVQLAVNFAWSLIFFNLQAFGFAFFWLLLLLALILWMIALFWKLDRPAALLQIPYLLWVSFAGYLNYAIWHLNG